MWKKNRITSISRVPALESFSCISYEFTKRSQIVNSHKSILSFLMPSLNIHCFPLGMSDLENNFSRLNSNSVSLEFEPVEKMKIRSLCGSREWAAGFVFCVLCFVFKPVEPVDWGSGQRVLWGLRDRPHLIGFHPMLRCDRCILVFLIKAPMHCNVSTMYLPTREILGNRWVP